MVAGFVLMIARPAIHANTATRICHAGQLPFAKRLDRCILPRHQVEQAGETNTPTAATSDRKPPARRSQWHSRHSTSETLPEPEVEHLGEWPTIKGGINAWLGMVDHVQAHFGLGRERTVANAGG
jgi:hypothetical protein